MRILILGGIGEAVKLARRLAPVHAVTYSVAGKGRSPDLPCRVRVGGFGGSEGLAAFLRENGIELLIDATHPYAAQISRNAALAARLIGIPLWAYRRPPWQPEPGDDWRLVANWAELQMELRGFRRPFFTLGLEPLRHVAEIPPEQRWLVRCLAAESPAAPRLTLLCATGPFSLEQELALLRDQRIDVLVVKNSGGGAVEAKLAAARQLHIPVVMLERPALPATDREFAEAGRLALELLESGWAWTGANSVEVSRE
jgi:precorrin-6A/cobalt-precorrin-6A reductase